MGVINRELVLLLAIAAIAWSDPIANKTAPKDADDNSIYQYEDYDQAVDQEEVMFNEDKPCPRDCMCSVAQGYRIANCNRLEVGTQKFGDDITDLVLENIDPRYPIQLEDNIFKKLGLHQVTTVKIVNSTISSVSPTAFHGLHELYAVTLTGNNLKTLHPETFANNKKLLLLTLAGNPLKFPAKGSQEYFLNASSVQELDISNCNMLYITANTFSQVHGLMYLNVAGNGLTIMDKDAFRNLPDLEELDLSDNDIMDLTGDLFSGNTELATLHIQRNPINTVYGLEIPDIVTLNAGQTRIKFVGPSMLNGMTYISNLNLSGNGIEKIHNQAFHKLQDLNYLDLSYNNLDFISSLLIYQNMELDIFKISNNPKLKRLPQNGFNCSADQFNIYLFDAANCGLEEISDNALSTFPSLTQINLSGNQLQSIGETVFAQCTRLVEVNLANNLLTTLGKKVFAQNKEISKLNLRGNPIKVLSSEVFIYMPKLMWLDISHGQLDSLWEKQVNHPAALLNNLVFLNISNNNINDIKLKEIESIGHLATLDVSNNPLQCNRDFESLMSWLSKHKVSSVVKDSLVANLVKDAYEEESAYSWESLARKVCKTDLNTTSFYKVSSTNAPATDEETWEKIENTENEDLKHNLKNIFDDAKQVDDEDNLEDAKDDENDADADDEGDEDEDDDDEDDDDYDNDIDLDIKLIDGEIKTNKPNKIKVQKSTSTPQPLKDNIDIDVKMLDEDEVYDAIEQTSMVRDEVIYLENEHGRYDYIWPILIVVLGALLLMLIIGKVVMVVCSRRRRQSRYNSAIIAAMSQNQSRTKKDCGLVYQQLSEELTGPTTPKLSRYAPLPAVVAKSSDVSYESSPFHHSNIVPEAV